MHDIDIFINDKWRKYRGGDIGRLFKITRRLELRFWLTRKQSQPSQGDFFARITLQREPCWCTIYSQTCLSDPLYITTSFVSRPYLFLPSVFPCIWPLYNDPLSNATNDRVLWVKILHTTTIRGLLSNRKLDNK